MREMTDREVSVFAGADKGWESDDGVFYVLWSARDQNYKVFKSMQHIVTVYSFSEAKNYL